MNNVGINTSAFASLVTPFSSTARPVVGLESPESKDQVLAAVEEPPASPATDKRGADNNTETDEQNERLQGRERQQLELEERTQVRELASRDREVRAHEQAHASVGGQYAGAPNFTYERGPNGVNYAVGGEVSIALPGQSDNPQQALQGALQVRRAALAPADPSAQDRRVAAVAGQLASQASQDIVAQKLDAQQEAREQTVQERKEQAELEEAKSIETEEKQLLAQRLDELRESSQRSQQLNEQLVTLDNIDRDTNVGSVLDRLA